LTLIAAPPPTLAPLQCLSPDRSSLVLNLINQA
jgi:hypothetical protein